MSVSAPETGEYLVGTVELRIPRKAEWVAVARLAASAIAAPLSFGVEDLDDIKLAVAEACTHAITHSDRTGSIDIVFERTTDTLTICVSDSDFDSASAKASLEAVPDKPGAALEDLGVFLIDALMDRVEYRIDGHRASRLTMTKRVAIS